jgi:GNAT superfamily N-acetyltransferase
MSSRPVALTFQPARPEELDECISISQACADRDGRRIDGIAETARAKFDHGVTWLVAESSTGLAGFVLCTGPGTDLPTDPQDAPVVEMLAVAPDHQGLSAGKGLLEHALIDLAWQGHSHAPVRTSSEPSRRTRIAEAVTRIHTVPEPS